MTSTQSNSIYLNPLMWIIVAVVMSIILSINVLSSRNNINEFRAFEAKIRKSADVQLAIEEAKLSLLRLEKYLALEQYSADDISKQRLRKHSESMGEKLTELNILGAANPHQQNNIALLSQNMQAFIDLAKRKVRTIQTLDDVEVLDVEELLESELRAALKAQFVQIRETESEYRNSQINKFTYSVKDAEVVYWVNFVISAIGSILVLFLARKIIVYQAEQNQYIENQNDQLLSAVEERTKELKLYSDELARSNRELEDFAFVASHDLQEPLRKIQTFSERLHSQFGEELPPKAQDYVHRMDSAAKRMSKLIKDLLAFSRINTKEQQLSMVDLNTVLESVLEDFSEAINDAGTSVTTAKLPTIQADFVQMQQLLYNLMGNAIKFSAKSPSPTVSISVSLAQSLPAVIDEDYAPLRWFKLVIADNGIGFDPSLSAQIFQPFHRFHGKSEYSGTGIGLAICRRIIERHSGAIVVHSEPNVGSQFSLYLCEQFPDVDMKDVHVNKEPL